MSRSPSRARVFVAKKNAISLQGFDERMTPAQILLWLSKQLNRAPEPFDLYHVGKMLYQEGAYSGSAKILQVRSAALRCGYP